MSKEELNNDFDVAVRVQKAFEEATREKSRILLKKCKYLTTGAKNE